MVGPDLEGLFLPHQEPRALILLVLQQLDNAYPTLLPLAVVKTIQLALAAQQRGRLWVRETGLGVVSRSGTKVACGRTDSQRCSLRVVHDRQHNGDCLVSQFDHGFSVSDQGESLVVMHGAAACFRDACCCLEAEATMLGCLHRWVQEPACA